MWVTHPAPLEARSCPLLPRRKPEKKRGKKKKKALPMVSTSPSVCFRSFAFPPSSSREEPEAPPGPSYVAVPGAQARYVPSPAGFVSAGARRACLAKASSVSLGMLYLERPDKHSVPGGQGAAERHRGSMQHRETLRRSGGYLLQAGLAPWGCCCMTAWETVWPGSCKAFLWINLVLSGKVKKRNKTHLKSQESRLLFLDDVRHLFLFVSFWNGY